MKKVLLCQFLPAVRQVPPPDAGRAAEDNSQGEGLWSSLGRDCWNTKIDSKDLVNNTFFMMHKLLDFHKKDKVSFEIKEDRLKQVEMSAIPNETMCLVDETQTGYDDPRWIEKSNSIKTRDNYTCKLCCAFNPMIEGGLFIKQGNYYTLHYYDRANSKYIIVVKDYDTIINFDFYSGFHLAMPR